MAEISHQDIDALVTIFDASDWQELRVVVAGTELYLSKNPGESSLVPAPEMPGDASITGPAAPVVTPAQIAVRAPHLGTFFTAPEPDMPPYVAIGQQVTADSEICRIEVMGSYTPLRAGVAGTVSNICVTDKQLVEYDQTLFLIEPLA